MDKFFATFGKVVGILLIAGGLLGGGFYLGQKYLIQKPISISPSQTVSPTTTTAQVTPTPTSYQYHPTGRFAVNAGGVKPFVAYGLSGVAGWTPNHTTTSGSDKLVLTKGDYSATILQAPLGGGGCTFPGAQPAEMSVLLSNPVAEIPLLDGTTLKRGQADAGTNPGKTIYSVCQKGQNNQYGSITTFGVINYVMPLNPDQSIVAEMDAMVGSLQKQSN